MLWRQSGAFISLVRSHFDGLFWFFSFLWLLDFWFPDHVFTLPGTHSLGQVLSSLLLAAILYLYFTRTRIVFRLVDFLINIVAGPILLHFSRVGNEDRDFSFGASFFQGLVYQVRRILLLYDI